MNTPSLSKFYVVATPIGNLEDITLRALRILKEVDLILCEDTQTTRILLQKYNIRTPCESYHAQSTDTKLALIFRHIENGKNIALVTDAGTPGISDPGAELIAQIRQYNEREIKEGRNGVEIISVPGPSALTAALAIAGVPVHEFVFLGFLPHKKGRKTLFEEMARSERAVIFYESPHRILKTLDSLAVECPAHTVVIARELTKVYEEVIRGTPHELITHFKNHPDTVRGEFVLILSAT